MKRILASNVVSISSTGWQLGRWPLLVVVLLLIVAVSVFWVITRGPLLTTSSVMVGTEAPPNTKANLPTIISDQISEEDYAVYSAALADPSFVNEYVKSVVVRDRTFKYLESKEGSSLDYFVAKTPGIRDEAAKDFEFKNKEEYRLDNFFQLKVVTVIVNSQEMDDMFAKDFFAAWQTVHNKYPNSSGIISLSRIGFDRERTQAIVHIGRGCGPICGESRFFLLTKEKGAWSIKSQLTTALS